MVSVRVRLFAALREGIGEGDLQLEFPDKVSCREIVSYLSHQYPAVETILKQSALLLNGSQAADEIVDSGDEIALLPPVSGG